MAMDCDGKTLAVVDESGWVTVWNIEVNNQLLYSLKLQVVHSSMSSLKKIQGNDRYNSLCNAADDSNRNNGWRNYWNRKGHRQVSNKWPYSRCYEHRFEG